MLVDVRGLAYRYPGGDQPVLQGLDFGIEEGEIFGFLGPNGSGKSTTQKLLTRILHGYEGRVRIFGEDLAGQGPAYLNRIGVCFEFPNLYEKLTAEENLEFTRGFYAGPTDPVRDWLERLDLPVGDRRRAGQFSKGMKMRLVLARSLIHRPRLWFLDEPTTGQDPEHAVSIRKLIRERAEAGTTVFLTTHDMTIADALCDRVAFLVDGRIAAVGTPRELKLLHANRVVRVEVAGAPPRDFDLDQPAAKAEFLRCVEEQQVETLHSQEPSLEDVFLRTTGRDLL